MKFINVCDENWGCELYFFVTDVVACQPVFVWHGVEATQLFAGCLMLSSLLINSPDSFVHSCPLAKPPRTPARKHKISLSHRQKLLELAYSDDKNRSEAHTGGHRVSQADVQTPTKIRWRCWADSWTSTSCSGVCFIDEHKILIFHQRQVNLKFTSNSNPESSPVKGDYKTFEAYPQRRQGKSKPLCLGGVLPIHFKRILSNC